MGLGPKGRGEREKGWAGKEKKAREKSWAAPGFPSIPRKKKQRRRGKKKIDQRSEERRVGKECRL